MENLFQLSHVKFVLEMMQTAFDGIEWFVAAYLVCIVFFFIIDHDLLNVIFVYPLPFMAVTIFNPFLIVPVAEVIGLTTRFRRLFWLLPVNLVLAYAFTSICTVSPRTSFLSNPPKNTPAQIRTNALRRAAAFVCCVAFIIVCGTSTKPYLRMPQNIYKTSTAILSISSIMEEDSRMTGLDKSALYSDQQLLELRQFDPTITSQLGRSELLNWEPADLEEETVRKVIESGKHSRILALVMRFGVRIDTDAFQKSIEACNINYIISTIHDDMGDYFAEAGFSLIGEAGIYEIYRITR